MSSAKRGMPLHIKILISLVLGFAAGLICQQMIGPGASQSTKDSIEFFNLNLAKPAGSIFLNMIFMIVVPLLFSALVLGVTEIGDAKKVGRVGLYSLGLTIVLSGIAVGIGLFGVNTLKPGAGITEAKRADLMEHYASKNKSEAEKRIAQSKEAKTAAETIVDIVPKNPIDAIVKDNILAFMFFALVFGLALGAIDPEKALPVKSFLEGVFAVSLKVIDFAMKLAPYGVFGLTFSAGLVLGLDALQALGLYVILVLSALAIHMFGVYSLVLMLIAKRKPLEFFRQIKQVIFTAFATSSSNATLPTALKVAEEEVGLPRDVSSFVLTVGATANQNGTALFEGITIIFLAQLFGVPLDLGAQLGIMGLAILGGVGTAGVPGGAWPVIAVILVKYGVPPEGIGLILGIDRILDMSRTVLNVAGDITIAACVSKLVGRKQSLEEAVAG